MIKLFFAVKILLARRIYCRSPFVLSFCLFFKKFSVAETLHFTQKGRRSVENFCWRACFCKFRKKNYSNTVSAMPFANARHFAFLPIAKFFTFQNAFRLLAKAVFPFAVFQNSTQCVNCHQLGVFLAFFYRFPTKFY